MALQVTAAGAALAPRAPAAQPGTPVRSQQPSSPPAKLTAEQVEQMVKEVKQVVEQVAQNLRFSVDESTGRTVITVTDAATKEVIRQIPSEEMLAVARALGRLQGLLLDKET